MQSGNLNLTDLSGPHRPAMGMLYLFFSRLLPGVKQLVCAIEQRVPLLPLCTIKAKRGELYLYLFPQVVKEWTKPKHY
jgi:hypothetical protein